MDLLNVILNLIYGFIFVPFAVCNLIYTGIKPFSKNTTLTRTITFAENIFQKFGLAYFIVLIINTLITSLIISDYSIFFGNLLMAYWLQPIIWISCSQLLQIPLIKKYSLFRILISIFILISIEYYIVLGSTIVRDYPNIAWDKLFKPGFIYAILFTKSFLFVFSVTHLY